MISKEARKALKSIKNSKSIFITAGGTGGHIIPAMKIASDIIKSGRKVIFITDAKFSNYKSLFEKESFFSSKKLKIKTLPITSYSGHFKVLFFLKNLVFSFFISLYLVLKNNPKIIIGFGGYTAFMPLLAGLLTFKTLILHEQNVVFGKVNRMFLRFAKHILLSFPDISNITKTDYKLIKNKIIVSGMPNFLPRPSKPREFQYRIIHDLSTKSKISILITGGSGGASFFSKNIPKAIIQLAKNYKTKQFIIYHQVKKGEIEATLKLYNKEYIPNLTLEIKPFFDNIPEILSKVEFAIIRAGASSIIECALSKVFTILIPMPNSAHNHQLKNARFIAKNNAGVMFQEKDYSSEKISMVISKAIEDGMFYFPIINTAGDLFKTEPSKVFSSLILEEDLKHFIL